MPFYLLIQLLHIEARFVDVQIKLVSERKLQKYQKRTYKNAQGQIFRCWQEFQSGERTAKNLLRVCAAIQANAPIIRV